MEEKEFVELIKRHSRIIHKLIYLYVDTAEDKKDLYQEVLFQAWKSIGTFRGKAAFSTWLYRVALNTILTFRRKLTVHDPFEHDSEMNISDPQNERSDNSHRLMMAIRQLNDIDKTIITLHLEDYDNGEIAGITGLSKNNVAVKLHRIKDELIHKLRRVA
ncbi:MAG: RNA polymerase sigma factor [Cyclobacteriaceae bacterium]